MSKSPEKAVKYEEAIEQVETIIDQIESGQAGLEECITQYERGMKLIARCQAILGKAEQRIAELTADAAGKLKATGSAAPDAKGDDEVEAQADDEPGEES